MRLILALGLAVLALPAAAQDAFFRSPTGNIHCAMFEGDWPSARCDLTEFTPSFARPADCDLDWGHAFGVAIRGQAQPLCAGDTVAVPGARVLGYGQSVTLGGITCTSAKTGMTCTNLDGRGFRVARARQSLF
jgi:hypothetical protein